MHITQKNSILYKFGRFESAKNTLRIIISDQFNTRKKMLFNVKTMF